MMIGHKSFHIIDQFKRSEEKTKVALAVELSMFLFFRSHGSDVLTVRDALQGSFRATLDVASVIVLTSRMGSLGMSSPVFIKII